MDSECDGVSIDRGAGEIYPPEQCVRQTQTVQTGGSVSVRTTENGWWCLFVGYFCLISYLGSIAPVPDKQCVYWNISELKSQCNTHSSAWIRKSIKIMDWIESHKVYVTDSNIPNCDNSLDASILFWTNIFTSRKQCMLSLCNVSKSSF